MNRYLDIGVGSLDLEGVLTIFREMRKESWWRPSCPVIIVTYRNDGDGEHVFLFPRNSAARRDAEYDRIVEILNKCSNGNEDAEK